MWLGGFGGNKSNLMFLIFQSSTHRGGGYSGGRMSRKIFATLLLLLLLAASLLHQADAQQQGFFSICLIWKFAKFIKTSLHLSKKMLFFKNFISAIGDFHQIGPDGPDVTGQAWHPGDSTKHCIRRWTSSFSLLICQLWKTVLYQEQVKFKIWIFLLSFANFQAALLKKVKLRICKSFSGQMPISGTTADHRGSIWIRTVASILPAGSFGHLSNVYSDFYLAYIKQTLPEAHVQCSAVHIVHNRPRLLSLWLELYLSELNFYSSQLQR